MTLLILVSKENGKLTMLKLKARIEEFIVKLIRQMLHRLEIRTYIAFKRTFRNGSIRYANTVQIFLTQL